MSAGPDWDLVARTFGRLVLATVGLFVGLWFIYGFGAGYFGYFAVPTPLNFVVAPAMLVGWMVFLCRYVCGAGGDRP